MPLSACPGCGLLASEGSACPRCGRTVSAEGGAHQHKTSHLVTWLIIGCGAIALCAGLYFILPQVQKGDGQAQRVPEKRGKAATPAKPASTINHFVWSKEPDSYRGVPWTATKDDVQKIITDIECYPDSNVCHSSFDLGLIPVEDIFTFKENNGELKSVILQYDAESYESIKAVFIDKYGKPESIDKEEVQTRMGVKYENETCFWYGKALSLSMSRFASDIERGSAFFSVDPTPEEAEKARKHLEEERKKAVDAL